MDGVQFQASRLPGVLSSSLSLAAEQPSTEKAVPATPGTTDDVQAIQPTNITDEPYTLAHGKIKASLDYDRTFNQVIITMQREDTGEVVQQFPPEKVLNLIATIMESLGSSLDITG